VKAHEVLAVRREVKDDSELRKLLDQVLVRMFDASVDPATRSSKDTQCMRRFVFYVFVSIFAAASLATITIVILGATGILKLHDPYINMLWSALVGEFVISVVWLVKTPFKQG
jgi:hypothetical protein